MAEQVDLAAPTGPTTPLWRFKTLTFDQGLTSDNGPIISVPSFSAIRVVLLGLNGTTLEHSWLGPSADADIVALNKANLSTVSLQRRLFNRLIADGVEGIVGGTVTGTPD